MDQPASTRRPALPDRRLKIFRLVRDNFPVDYFTVDDVESLLKEAYPDDDPARNSLLAAMARLVEDGLLHRHMRGVFVVRRPGDVREDPDDEPLTLPKVRRIS